MSYFGIYEAAKTAKADLSQRLRQPWMCDETYSLVKLQGIGSAIGLMSSGLIMLLTGKNDSSLRVLFNVSLCIFALTIAIYNRRWWAFFLELSLVLAFTGGLGFVLYANPPHLSLSGAVEFVFIG